MILNLEVVKVGYLKTNCYILSINNDVLVIDPGDCYNKIKKVINNRNVVGVIITHNHFDHIGALNYFNNIYDYNNLKEGKNKIGNFIFEVIYTNGHTSDSISLYFKEYNMMFVGDFIFKDGIGRTDLGGNINDMISSLRKISKYDKNTKIYPGHGDFSTLGLELNKISKYLDY